MKIKCIYSQKLKEGTIGKDNATLEPLVYLKKIGEKKYELSAMVFVPQKLKRSYIAKNKTKIVDGIYLECKGIDPEYPHKKKRRDFEVSYVHKKCKVKDYMVVYFKVEYRLQSNDEIISPLEAIDINLINLSKIGETEHRRGTKSTSRIVYDIQQE